MKRNRNLIIIVIITVILLFTVGVTYTIFNYEMTGTNNNQLVVGDIYMHYNEINQLTILDAMPYSYSTYKHNNNITADAVTACITYFETSDSYGTEFIEGLTMNGESIETFCDGTGTAFDLTFQQSLDDDLFFAEDLTYFVENNIIKYAYADLPYFEFTISGKNTVLDKDIFYEINLSYGDAVAGKTTRIRDDLLKFSLIEYNDGVSKNILTNYNFDTLNNKSIWTNTISSETVEEINRTYRLYMWIDGSTKICGGDISEDCDYYLNNAPNWNDVYASIKVDVTGDFIEKNTHYDVLRNDLLGDIDVARENIKEIYFQNLSVDEINTRYEQAVYKSSGVDSNFAGDKIKIWLEEDMTDAGQYIMYVASDTTIYFPNNCREMFREFNNLEKIEFSNIDTSNVTDMNYMFFGCSSLTSLDLSNFDTSNVTDMSGMFSYCSSLTSLNLSNFDTSDVTNMSGMFSYCSSLTSLDLSKFDTSNVTNMNGMFYYCSSLTSLNLSNFDTSDVTNMSNMFNNCSLLTTLNLNNFETSNVTDMSGMFSYCSSLTSLNLNSFDTGNVTYMNSMFFNCSSLTSLDLSNFNTSDVTDMSVMFYGCSSLTSLDLSNFDTDNVTDMMFMFVYCYSLTSLNLSNFTFNNDLVLNGNYKDMFIYMPANAIVKVKSDVEQNFILSLSSQDRPSAWSTSNVII